MAALNSFSETMKSGNRRATLSRVSERVHVIAQRLLAALDELNDGIAIRWVKARDLDHVSETTPPEAIWRCYHGFVLLSQLNLPL